MKGGHITVRASTRPGDDGGTLLVLEVHDTGAGLKTPAPAVTASGTGFGLARCASAWPHCMAHRELLN